MRKAKEFFQAQKEQHFIWISEPATGLGFLLYLPFQDYSCQVLIRVIRVKNVISFQRYFEQIPLISFLKKHRRRGRLYGMNGILPEKPICPGLNFQITAKNSAPLASLAQKTAGFSVFLPPSLYRILQISIGTCCKANCSSTCIALHHSHPIATMAMWQRARAPSDLLYVKNCSTVHSVLHRGLLNIFLCLFGLVPSPGVPFLLYLLLFLPNTGKAYSAHL